jgi:acetoin utilization protein AcuC
MAEALGAPIPPETALPEGFHAFVLEALGRQAPGRMTDGREPWPRPLAQGFDPDDPVDAAILATREAVFPHHGLHPEPDLWF